MDQQDQTHHRPIHPARLPSFLSPSLSYTTMQRPERCSKNDDQYASRRDPVSPFVTFKRFADEQFSSLMNRAFGSNPFILNPAISYQAFKRDYESWLKECRESDGRPMQFAQDEAHHSKKPGPEGLAWGSCPYRCPAEIELSDQEQKDLRSFVNHEAVQKASLTPSNDNPEKFRNIEIEVKGWQDYSWLRSFVKMLHYLESVDEQQRLATREEDRRWGDSAARDVDIPRETARNSTLIGNLNVSFEEDEEDIVNEIRSEVSQLHEDADDTGETELNLFLGLKNTDAAIEADSSSQSIFGNLASAMKPSDAPSILSTLTTTQKVTLPNGKVISKLTLKTRFSDGREETSESEHVQHPFTDTLSRQTRTIIGETQPPKEPATSSTKPARSRGWFWN